MKDQPNNPWTVEDERHHPGSRNEWWCIEAFLRSEQQGRHWSVRAYLWESHEKPDHLDSMFIITLLDEKTGKHTTYTSKKPTGLTRNTESFEIHFDDSWITGRYPQYTMALHDKDHDIHLNLQYTAASLPHWVAQDVTDGWLPAGFGLFRFGFIPKCTISGTVTSNGESIKTHGQGYLEHVYGDFSYTALAAPHGQLRKTASTYLHLIGWWLTNNTIRLPTDLMFTSENNPMGNDWAWALLDNGWTIFYGNLLFWLMGGPAMGIFILSKDGSTYTEFGTIRFKYKRTKYEKTYDFVYPTELELTAIKGEETFHLVFDMDPTRNESIDVFSHDDNHVSLVVCENPGTVKGYYQKGHERISVSGICKLELQRQLSQRGHNSLRLNIIYPPQGIGCDSEFDSHFFNKTITAHFHLAPKPRIQFSIKRRTKT